MLTNECVKKDSYKTICENKVSFITFNYDRSLEHFLHESLINSFSNVNRSELTEQLNAFPFIHVFGQIAPLPWQKKQGDLPLPLDYGIPATKVNMINSLRKNIRTIYDEKLDPAFNEQLQKTQDLISNAKRVFFLGFGYAKENLELLKIPDCLKTKQKIYGTALGATEKEIKQIAELLNRRELGKQEAIYLAKIHDWDCRKLLREYL